MIFTPTNTIPGNFDAVSSEEIQNMVKKDIDPIPGASRTGRYSILFTLDGDNTETEWKYASASDRDTDYDAIIAAANAGGGGGVAPTTLQAVTNNGATTSNQVIFTNDVIFDGSSDRSFSRFSGMSGEHGAAGSANTTWTIDTESGRATFVDVYDQNGPLSSLVTIVPITSAEILTLGSVGVEILQAPGANTYFSQMIIALEFTPGTTPYTLGTGTILTVVYDGGSYIAKADSFALSDTAEAAWILTYSPTFEITNNPVFGNVEINSGIFLKLEDPSGGAVDPTLGDGTLRAVIQYKIRTFGS